MVRRMKIQWGMRTILLFTTSVAIWFLLFRMHSDTPRLLAESESRFNLANRLFVRDVDQFALIKELTPVEYEHSWNVHLPAKNDYVLRASTEPSHRGKTAGWEPGNGHELEIQSGKHEITLIPRKVEDSWRVAISVDQKEVLLFDKQLKRVPVFRDLLPESSGNTSSQSVDQLLKIGRLQNSNAVHPNDLTSDTMGLLRDRGLIPEEGDDIEIQIWIEQMK